MQKQTNTNSIRSSQCRRFRSVDRREIILGGCHVERDYPNNYCLKCRKRLKLDFNGLIIDRTDKVVYNYIHDILSTIDYRIYCGMKKTDDLKEYLKKEEYLDENEFNTLIEKLRTLNFIRIDDDEISIIDMNEDK